MLSPMLRPFRRRRHVATPRAPRCGGSPAVRRSAQPGPRPARSSRAAGSAFLRPQSCRTAASDAMTEPTARPERPAARALRRRPFGRAAASDEAQRAIAAQSYVSWAALPVPLGLRASTASVKLPNGPPASTKNAVRRVRSAVGAKQSSACPWRSFRPCQRNRSSPSRRGFWLVRAPPIAARNAAVRRVWVRAALVVRTSVTLPTTG